MKDHNVCKFSNVSSGDLICAELVYENTEVQATPASSDRYILGFVVNGNGILHQGIQAHPLCTGNLFFVQKNSRFSICFEGEHAYFYISYYGRRADELTDRFGLSEGNCVFEIADNYEKLKTFAFHCMERANAENTDILGECALLYFFSHLNIQKRQQPNLLSDMILITNQSFTEPQFSLGVLSDRMGYDPKYLSFFFKKNKGIRYSQYLRDLRIKRSVFLMEQGLTSIKNIALLSGFSDALYYSKIFKKEIGKTPKEYLSFLEKKDDAKM